MFGRDKEKTPDKERKLSPKDMMAQKMDEMETGKELMFKLGQIYVKPYITVLHNPQHPGKGKRFIAYQDGVGSDGKPAGKRGQFWETDKSRDIASWVLEREGNIYNG